MTAEGLSLPSPLLKPSPVVRVTATPPMVTVSLAWTLNVPAASLSMVTVQVATSPLTVGPLTVGVRPPLTVTPSAPKLGAPVPAGKAVSVTVNVSALPTSLTGVRGVMLMFAST